MKLSATQIKAAKPGSKPKKLFDGKGLFLLINPNGSKYWRMRYRIGGRDKTLALGVYPGVSLKKARQKCDEAKRDLDNQIDPVISKQAAKQASEGADTFEAVAREWFAKQKGAWAASHSDKIIRRLERDIFPWLGRRATDQITAPELLAVLRRIENRGTVETAHRAKQNCGQIFRYAVATGRAERDPSADLRGALAAAKGKHFASVQDPKAVGALLRALDGYDGTLITRSALQLAPLVFVRPGELRAAEWAEFNLAAQEWRIPGERMKGGTLHIVPLSEQVLSILETLQHITGRGRYLFPGVRSVARPMSENTVNAALRRLGYTSDQMTGHGFRSIASTMLNEQGWNADAIERQLAHAERDSVRAAYNYAEHLPERRKMMQHWSDYLDGLKRGADVISIHSKAKA